MTETRDGTMVEREKWERDVRHKAAKIDAVAMAIWRARERRFLPRLRRLEPDEIDRASGAWRDVIDEACAALDAASDFEFDAALSEEG